MAQATAPRVRSLYRRILRELPSRTSSTTSSIQQRLRSQFNIPSEPSTESLEVYEQMTQYLHAQRSYTTLVERYNPGMNMTEEERTRLSARRVGMEMPKQFQGIFEGPSGGGKGEGGGSGKV